MRSALTEEEKAHKRGSYFCLVDFQQTFDIIPHVCVMQKLEASASPGR